MKTKYVIEKGLEVKVTNPTNVFVVTIGTYYGDADGYEDLVLTLKTEKEVSDLISLLDIMGSVNHNEFCDKGYSIIDGWRSDFNWLSDHWPANEWAGGYDNSFESLKSIIWYNEDGVGFNCSFHERG